MIAARVVACALLSVAALGGSEACAGTDADLLRALHEKVIRAHQRGTVELLLEDEAEAPDYVVASRGEVTRPSLAERRAH